MSAFIFETPAFGLRNPDKEHADICRRFEELEAVILRPGSMHSIHRILAAADNLVQMILLHFTHEEQLPIKLSRYSLQRKQRETKIKITTQLSGIKAELEQGKVTAVFQLLRLSKFWIKEQIHLESEGDECEEAATQHTSFRYTGVLHDNAPQARRPA
jgi:hemerythrin